LSWLLCRAPSLAYDTLNPDRYRTDDLGVTLPASAALRGSPSPFARRPRVLVVEDSETTSMVIAATLEGAGYEVRRATTGLAGVEAARSLVPDLVVLDVELPDTDGFEVCRRLREFSGAVVVMLTARTGENDTLTGLESGADDYVLKPCSPRELSMRVAAHLRRCPELTADGLTDGFAVATPVLEVADLTLDPGAREVVAGGERVELTRIEFDLLEVMMARPKHVHRRESLLESVWGADWIGDDHLVSVHMGNLRGKIDLPGTPSRVLTVRGVGYRMAPQA